MITHHMQLYFLTNLIVGDIRVLIDLLLEVEVLNLPARLLAEEAGPEAVEQQPDHRDAQEADPGQHHAVLAGADAQPPLEPGQVEVLLLDLRGDLGDEHVVFLL